MGLTAGVIAVQGDVAEHAAAIERAGEAMGESVEVVEVRGRGIVPDCDVLTMPGGESTTISRTIRREGIAPEIVDHVEADKPLLATCAGLIVAADSVDDDRVDPLGVLDVSVERNAFGRQRDSFEIDLSVAGLDDPFPAVFIRAPVITDTGRSVEVIAEHDRRIVAVRDPPVVATAFHPELTPSTAVHELAFADAL